MYTYVQKVLYALLVAVLFVTGCTSVEKLVDQGNYDAAIDRAKRYLAGKKKPNPKYIVALRDALEAANDRDLHYASQLKNRGGSTDWGRVFDLYAEIDRRQEGVRSLLPLVDKHGLATEVRFVRVEPMLAEARQRAADQSYQRGMTLLANGRRGQKADARAAFRAFSNTRRYLTNFRDVVARQAEAEALGIVYVLVEVENRVPAYLPAGLERELLQVDTRRLDDQWRRYHLGRERGLDYDFRAKLLLQDVQVSPERVTERAFTETKEITDGEEYVLDVNGNVAKDSLGNDITQPRRITIGADILEVFQQKQAILSGELLLLSNTTNRILERRALTAEAVFENYASSFRGDRRALTAQTRNRIGSQPGPFPTDEAMILQAADRLKPILLEQLVTTDVTYLSR